MPKNKAFKQIQKHMSQKKKDQGKLKSEDQNCYVDSTRNIAVSLDSKELSKALKQFDKEGVKIQKIYSNNPSNLGF